MGGQQSSLKTREDGDGERVTQEARKAVRRLPDGLVECVYVHVFINCPRGTLRGGTRIAPKYLPFASSMANGSASFIIHQETNITGIQIPHSKTSDMCVHALNQIAADDKLGRERCRSKKHRISRMSG